MLEEIQVFWNIVILGSLERFWVEFGIFVRKDPIQFVELLLATGFIFYIGKLVHELQYQRQHYRTPQVVVNVELSKSQKGFVDIVISNIGDGAAYQVHIRPKTEFILDEKGNKLENQSFFSFHMLKPKQQIVSIIGEYKRFKTYELAFDIRYEDHYKKKYKTHLKSDLLSYMDLVPEMEEQYEMARSLTGIAESLRHLTTGFKRLNVDIFDKQDRQKEALETKQTLQRISKREGMV